MDTITFLSGLYWGVAAIVGAFYLANRPRRRR